MSVCVPCWAENAVIGVWSMCERMIGRWLGGGGSVRGVDVQGGFAGIAACLVAGHSLEGSGDLSERD